MQIEITEIEKTLLEGGEETSLYGITYRANGELLYQVMQLNNELPDDILKQHMAKIAQLRFQERFAENKGG